MLIDGEIIIFLCSVVPVVSLKRRKEMMKWKVSGQKNGVLLMFEVACLDNATCQIVTLIVPYQDQPDQLSGTWNLGIIKHRM